MKSRLAFLVVLGSLAFCWGTTATPVCAQDSALLDALVKKGVLSDQEAEDIRADEEKDYASTSASKINLSSSIKSITFYGDLRLRFELRDATEKAGDTNGGTAAGPTALVRNDSQTRDRWRYRLRFGFKGDLYDNFFYGVRFATNPYYNRSGNVTFGDTDSAGPFGKAKSLITADQIYLGWKPTSEITLTGGQMPQPFYTTSMVWDDNLNPAGAAEQYDKSFDNGLEVFATAGQFIYGDSPDNSIGSVERSDIFMFGEQAGIKYKFNDDTAFKVAATMYEYSGANNGSNASVIGYYQGANGSGQLNLNDDGSVTAPVNNNAGVYSGPFVGAAQAPYTNVTGINDLQVIEVPAEFDFKGFGVPMRFFSDFAYNVEADERANTARTAIRQSNQAGVTGLTGTGTATNRLPTYQGVLTSGKGFLDQAAYQIGYEAGVLKKKGDWQTRLYYQSTGYYALDPNLVDSDIFNAATNMQGAVVSASYNWTDGLTSTIRYAYGTQVNDKMATPNVNQDIQTSVMRTYDLFQADLMWKF